MGFEVALAEEIWTAKYRFAPAHGVAAQTQRAIEQLGRIGIQLVLLLQDSEVEVRRKIIRIRGKFGASS